jgi:hypothetical protein
MIGGKTGRFAIGVALGLLAGVGLMLVAIAIFRDPTPELTVADYEAAVRRWDAHGPGSYDLDLDLEGNRPGKIHVEVRQGKITHMTRDGIEPRQKRTWEYWSVPGQLDTIGQELEKAGNPAEGFQTPPGSRMVQRAVFDPQYGYPIRYQRIILGSNLEIRWQVTRFVPRDGPQGDVR